MFGLDTGAFFSLLFLVFFLVSAFSNTRRAREFPTTYHFFLLFHWKRNDESMCCSTRRKHFPASHDFVYVMPDFFSLLPFFNSYHDFVSLSLYCLCLHLHRTWCARVVNTL